MGRQLSVVIGVDIGGTKTHAVVVSDSGRTLGEARYPTGRGPAAVVDVGERAVLEALTRAGRDRDEVTRIGVGVPGAVDIATGRVSHAVNLEVADLDLRSELERRLARPVRVDNDVNVAALGAWSLLGRDPSESLAYLNLGTGMAAGLVVGGRVWRGASGVAGEIGHLPGGPPEIRCACGQLGCLELSGSGSGWARASGGDTVGRVREKARAGDPRAIRLHRDLVAAVAAAVRILALAVDPQRIVVGGGLAAADPGLVDDVRAVLAGQARQSPLIARLDLGPRLDREPPDHPVAPLGAAVLALEEI